MLFRSLHALRAIFLAFMAWLTVIFLPGHTRGAITFNRDGDGCCAAVAPSPSHVPACCVGRAEGDGRDAKHPPSQKDREACAVCQWAAGLIPEVPVIFTNDHVEQALQQARAYHAQVRAVACRLNQFGRDPPSVVFDCNA